MIATTQTVREMALEVPSSIRVFEQFGIDYCCGGRKPLAEACEAGNVDVDAVIAALEEAVGKTPAAFKDWTAASLESLSAHIVATHHAYVREELPRLASLSQKVIQRHGGTRPELHAIQATLEELDAELIQHLPKEEAILFPYIAALESAWQSGTRMPQGCFGTVSNPIAMMMREHDSSGTRMARIRALSSQYMAPEGACPTYRAFYDGLREFEQDLHQHIHLENNILFPRAMDMEHKLNQKS